MNRLLKKVQKLEKEFIQFKNANDLIEYTITDINAEFLNQFEILDSKISDFENQIKETYIHIHDYLDKYSKPKHMIIDGHPPIDYSEPLSYEVFDSTECDSIVQFSFSDVTYKCSLNNNGAGRKKYGSLQDLLATNDCVNSTVGIHDGTNVELPHIRKSKKYNSIIEFDLDPEIVEFNLRKLVKNDKAYWTNKQKYEVIEYSKNGFFKTHSDKQIKRTHYGTLLIFPPAIGELSHTGGELILDKGRVQFDSSKNKEFTFIAFHTNLLHECKEVLSGKRVVFKTELYSTVPVNHHSKLDMCYSD